MERLQVLTDRDLDALLGRLLDVAAPELVHAPEQVVLGPAGQRNLIGAACGARVLLGARSADGGRAAASAIRSRVPEADLEVVAADLSDMRQVRSLAEQVRQHTTRLDGLVLNAAEVRTRRELTSDGFETNFATNYLSGFLLTHLLLPLLTSSAPARIVALSSSNHAHIKHLDLDVLPTGEDFNHMRTYSTTKLLNVLFVVEFARRVHGAGVTANAADPGIRAHEPRPARDGPVRALPYSRASVPGVPRESCPNAHLSRHRTTCRFSLTVEPVPRWDCWRSAGRCRSDRAGECP